MAAPEKPSEQDLPPPTSVGLWVWIVVGLSCALAGAAGAFLLPVQAESPQEKPIPAKYELPTREATVFVKFDKVVVNLDEGRLTRYLSLALTLETAKTEEQEFQKRLAAKNAVLRNWLLSTIADRDIDDIRGAAGQNRLRREIRDHFNSVLYPEGFDRIYDVLFDEFNVQ